MKCGIIIYTFWFPLYFANKVSQTVPSLCMAGFKTASMILLTLKIANMYSEIPLKACMHACIACSSKAILCIYIAVVCESWWNFFAYFVSSVFARTERRQRIEMLTNSRLKLFFFFWCELPLVELSVKIGLVTEFLKKKNIFFFFHVWKNILSVSFN